MRTREAMGSWEARMVLEMRKELEAEDEGLAVRRRSVWMRCRGWGQWPGQGCVWMG